MPNTSRPALAFTCALALSFPPAAQAGQSDVAFDQLQRVYIFGAEPPPIGTYEALRQSFNALGPSVTYPLLPGVVGDVPRQREGVMYRYSFLGKLERVDDPASMKATIGRPDRGEVDYLDLKAKTYRTVTGDAATALLSPNLAQQIAGAFPSLPSGSAPRGTLTMTYHVESSPLDQRTFDGTATSGYLAKVAVSAAGTGTCPAVSATTAITVYVDATRPEPFIPTASALKMADLDKAMTGLGCSVTVAGAVPSPDPALAHFIFYERADVTLTLPHVPTPIQTSTVVERSHVAPLGPADVSLFEIPAGFSNAGDGPGRPAPASPGPAK